MTGTRTNQTDLSSVLGLKALEATTDHFGALGCLDRNPHNI